LDFSLILQLEVHPMKQELTVQKLLLYHVITYHHEPFIQMQTYSQEKKMKRQLLVFQIESFLIKDTKN